MEKIRAIICDVDNTIIDITHRYHLLKGKETDWNAFLDENLIRKDHAIKDVIDIIRALKYSGYAILFVTGRNSGIEQITREQIETYCGFDNCDYQLFMRPDEDRETPDADVKLEIYKNYIEPHYEVVMAFDDRQVIVDLWRSLGITTSHVGERALGGGF